MDHHRRALKSLEANIPAVITHLSEIVCDQCQDIKKCDAAKVRSWINKIGSHNFLLHMGLYVDFLTKLERMVSLPAAVEAVSITEQVLRDMAKHDGQKLRD